MRRLLMSRIRIRLYTMILLLLPIILLIGLRYLKTIKQYNLYIFIYFLNVKTARVCFSIELIERHTLSAMILQVSFYRQD